MTMWMQTATRVAGEVYQTFLEQVVDQGVLDERIGALSDENRRKIQNGTHIDARVLRLMAMSGKGGWHSDPVRRTQFAQSTNVTLLDHLLSVIRGAMLLAALDWLGRNPDMDQALLQRRLRVIAVIAFLHDLDKLIDLQRNVALPLDEIGNAMRRYRLAEFLGNDIELTPEQVRYLIEQVEDTQNLRSPVRELPPREFEALTGYVALADKLDGIWLSGDPEKGGLNGVLKRLRADQTLATEVLRDWKPLEIMDPHHPFLLDELQRWLSWISLRLAGVPPLIEVHQDGRLFLLLPLQAFDRIVDEALNQLCAALPFQLELDISNRGVPALYNGQPDHGDLQAFIADLDDRNLGSLFRVKAELMDTLTPHLDDLLAELDLKPRWPGSSGATITPYPKPGELSVQARDHLHRAAHLVLLLNLKLDSAKKLGLPDYAERETALLSLVSDPRPDWLSGIDDDASRRVITALWVKTLAWNDADLEEAVWGTEGLLKHWLEGGENQPGFRNDITGRGTRVIEAVQRHFRQLLGGSRIAPDDETAAGRCLFTDEPVPFDESIDKSLGLYEVNVSAFSGRDGRPESITSERAHTNVGPVSVAEHKLRAQAHARQGGKPSGVPTLISSPTTSGLFGGLRLPGDRSMPALSIYDLSRQEVKKDTIYYRGTEIFQARYRMARFERMAEKAKGSDKKPGQINQLRMLLQATRRIGRPVHIYRGLPTPQRAFFYYDAMPRMLVELIGGNRLRLEQIPEALDRLVLAQTLLDTNGLGYDVLRRYAAPKTRFGATCLAWCHLHDDEQDGKKGNRWVMSRLQHEFLQQLENPTMSTEDGALVRLGKMAARIQSRRVSSTNDELLVFKFCMETAAATCAAGQDDEQSLIYAIAGELETNLTRKGKAAASKHRDGQALKDGCLDLATFFVREIWNGVLKRRPPSQTNRRVFSSIYRMAFLQAVRNRPDDEKPTETAITEGV